MQLKELSRQAGISAASIKYYLREGLLQPGRSRHATLAEYGDEHLLRLRLIHSLRDVVGLSIGKVRTLIQLIHDPQLDFAELLGKTQSLVLGYDFAETKEHPLTAAVVQSRSWPDVHTDARQGLNAQLSQMESLGLEIRPDLLESYAEAVDAVARQDISTITDTGNRDQAVLTVAVGVHQYSTLLVRMLALAQTSASIQAYGTAGRSEAGRS
ncbi:MerR family transcriptional regulator [Arthrobacter castelli]|uniref:MerR family transcriptional regulator n=1 Tax=Arthrobacter castelli TaxID=271431 RepID=UPI000410432D|nr:MerR family transcriptional regulator [Arthrobacter castelli]